MRARLRISAEAWADIEQCHAYLLEHDLDASLRFLDAVDRTLASLEAHPRLGPFHQAKSAKTMAMRRIVVSGFGGYIIFYRMPDESSVEVARVLHAARDIPAILGYPVE